jgi:integrase
MSLNVRSIRTAQPGDILCDEEVSGLHLRCNEKKKSFLLYYRSKTGQQRRPRIGNFGEMTLEQARDRARAMLLEVRAGGDPKGRWDKMAKAATVAELADRFFLDHAAELKSRDEQMRLWSKYVEPTALAKKKVAEVSHEDIDQLHRRHADTPHQANRILQMLSSMFTRSEIWRDSTGKVMRSIGTNPCQHVRRYKEPKRRRYMTQDEMAAVLDELRKKESRYPAGVAFVRLLIYTGARSNEIRTARWEWIRGDYIEFPEGATKTEGTAEAGVSRVFLSPPAKAVLDSLPRTSGTITGIESPKNLWYTVTKKAGCPGLRMHDCRHSFASVGLSNGMTLEQIGELLNHRSRLTTQRYAHLMEDRARASVAAIGAAQMAMLAAAKPKPG